MHKHPRTRKTTAAALCALFLVLVLASLAPTLALRIEMPPGPQQELVPIRVAADYTAKRIEVNITGDNSPGISRSTCAQCMDINFVPHFPPGKYIIAASTDNETISREFTVAPSDGMLILSPDKAVYKTDKVLVHAMTLNTSERIVCEVDGKPEELCTNCTDTIKWIVMARGTHTMVFTSTGPAGNATQAINVTIDVPDKNLFPAANGTLIMANSSAFVNSTNVSAATPAEASASQAPKSDWWHQFIGWFSRG